jgi:hypothetical protein
VAKKAWTLLDWYDRDSHPPTDIPTATRQLQRLLGSIARGPQRRRRTAPREHRPHGSDIPTKSRHGYLEDRLRWCRHRLELTHPWPRPPTVWFPSLIPPVSGWLEGFDELLVRCGLQSNGAPQFTPQGQLQYPLHGRIANLPVEYVEVTRRRRKG